MGKLLLWYQPQHQVLEMPARIYYTTTTIMGTNQLPQQSIALYGLHGIYSPLLKKEIFIVRFQEQKLFSALYLPDPAPRCFPLLSNANTINT